MAINSISVSGNLGKDCVQRWTPNGKAVASFSLPVKQGFGEHEKTSWVTCKLLGSRAEKLPAYLTKGTKVTIVGEFLMEEWTDKDNNARSSPVIIVNQIGFGSSSNQQAGSQQKPQQQGWGQPQQPPTPQNIEPPMDFDDDIPF